MCVRWTKSCWCAHCSLHSTAAGRCADNSNPSKVINASTCYIFDWIQNCCLRRACCCASWPPHLSPRASLPFAAAAADYTLVFSFLTCAAGGIPGCILGLTSTRSVCRRATHSRRAASTRCDSTNSTAAVVTAAGSSERPSCCCCCCWVCYSTHSNSARKCWLWLSSATALGAVCARICAADVCAVLH
jgi:hypothetical protein